MKLFSKFIAFLPHFILLCFLVVGIKFSYTIEPLTNQVFDLYQRISPRTFDIHYPVKIADIDDQSLKQIGQWPWPRTVMAELTKKLTEAGAKAVVFDIVFSEPDRMSPQQYADKINVSDEIKQTLKQLPNNDEIFAEAMKKAPVVLGFPFTNQESTDKPVRKAGFASATANFEDNAIQYLSAGFIGVITNRDLFEKYAKGIGSFNIFSGETDDVQRRIPLLFQYKGQLYPSLAGEALRVAQRSGGYKLKMAGGHNETSFGTSTGLSSIKIGKYVLPVDASGKIWLYDTGHKRERFIPIWEILEGKDLSIFKDAIVFVGTSSVGLKDIRRTPINRNIPGVEINAQIVEQVLTDNYILRPDWARGVEIFYLFFFSLLLIFLLPRVGAATCALIGFLSILIVIVGSWMAFSKWKLLLDPLLPSIAVLVIYLVSSFLNYKRTENERGKIRHAFSHYLTPSVVEQLAQNPDQLKLGGEMKTMTFLFTDIRKFTTLSEGMSPETLSAFMNAFLTPMTDIILKHGGTIDKYMGDCIMAFWNAPLEDPHHARNACEAALEMRATLDAWNNEENLKQYGLKEPVSIGVGINTGPASVGNFGSDQRFDYSVLGDAVNLASRIEGLSKRYGFSILIGSETHRTESDHFAMLEVDLIKVKGKETAENIFALIGKGSLEKEDAFKKIQETSKEMFSAYRAQQWNDAEQKCAELSQLSNSELDLKTLCALYAERIEEKKKNPPDKNWAGIETATTK